MAAACLAQCLADNHPRCARAGSDRRVHGEIAVRPDG